MIQSATPSPFLKFPIVHLRGDERTKSGGCAVQLRWNIAFEGTSETRPSLAARRLVTGSHARRAARLSFASRSLTDDLLVGSRHRIPLPFISLPLCCWLVRLALLRRRLGRLCLSSGGVSVRPLPMSTPVLSGDHPCVRAWVEIVRELDMTIGRSGPAGQSVVITGNIIIL